MSNHGLNAGRKRRYKSEIIRRDGDRCVHCGVALGDDITLEHIVPVKHGGRNKLENLALAHAECNLRRDRGGEMDAEQRRELAMLLANYQ